MKQRLQSYFWVVIIFTPGKIGPLIGTELRELSEGVVATRMLISDTQK